MLMSLPEVQRRRLLDGDWNVSEGAAFSYYETLETPGIKSMTKIIEEQTIESISDSTSTFQ